MELRIITINANSSKLRKTNENKMILVKIFNKNNELFSDT